MKSADVQMKIEAGRELWRLGCPAQARAALALAEEAASALGEFERARIEDDLRSLKHDVTTLSTGLRRLEEYQPTLERYVHALERSIEFARSMPDREDVGYERNARDIRAMIGDDDNQALLGAELRAKVERQLAWIADEIVKARLEASLARAEELQGQIQAMLDGQDTSATTETVDKWFRWAAAALARCPDGHPQADALRARLDEQRRTLEKNVAEQYLSDVIEPALNYWTYVNETYGPEARGWESESRVTSVPSRTRRRRSSGAKKRSSSCARSSSAGCRTTAPPRRSRRCRPSPRSRRSTTRRPGCARRRAARCAPSPTRSSPRRRPCRPAATATSSRPCSACSSSS
jgi:hypothetical protein